MTLDELLAKKDAVLKDADVANVQWGDRSVTKVVDKPSVVALLDRQIIRAQVAAGIPMIRQLRMFSNSKGFD